MKLTPTLGIVFLLASGLDWVGGVTAQMSESEGIDFFEARIRPVLIRECYGCHSDQSGQSKGGLKLDTKQGLLLGGDSGPSLVAGSLEDSPLWSAINYEDYAMPPNRPLAAHIIEDFRVWIESGAADPRSPAASDLEISATVSEEDIAKARWDFWAFQVPRKSALPAVADPAWPRGPVDEYVLAELEENQLASGCRCGPPYSAASTLFRPDGSAADVSSSGTFCR